MKSLADFLRDGQVIRLGGGRGVGCGLWRREGVCDICEGGRVTFACWRMRLRRPVIAALRLELPEHRKGMPGVGDGEVTAAGEEGGEGTGSCRVQRQQEVESVQVQSALVLAVWV